jgi:hypothetical protein
MDEFEREWTKRIMHDGGGIRRSLPPNFPKIVCLCGSTRSYREFQEQDYRLTMEGCIVLSVGCNIKSDDSLGITTDQKTSLDELHKRKIDLCDEILVLNVGSYIGESTRSEIEYAAAAGKLVQYLGRDVTVMYWEQIGGMKP